MSIVDYKKAIADTIASEVPELYEAKPYRGEFNVTEAKKVNIVAPCALVAALSLNRTDRVNNAGELLRNAKMAVYVLTDNYRRYNDCDGLAEKIEAVIYNNRWGRDNQPTPHKISARNFYHDNLVNQGLTLWVISFEQLLAPALNVEIDVTPSRIMLGISPYVGSEHKDKYIEIDREKLTEVAEGLSE